MLFRPRLFMSPDLRRGPAEKPCLGRDIRVGLEDTTILADGRPASGNGELVEAAVSLAAALGRPA
ncbi:MAG TPA: 3-keto-5-aminohexanoate cleavage protein [Streptosporangiaceae bacterium]|nr:3-keto-5-aminohexanoate cleavage protein [Streptosporangiaceae bacterium]